MKRRKKSDEPFIPNDNLYKTRKIEFQNPYAVPHLKSYNFSKQSEKINEIETIQKSVLFDKNKNIEINQNELKRYPDIIAKLNKSNIIQSVKNLDKEERNIILLKYYEVTDNNHSYNVFKQSYTEFLEQKTLTKSIFIERIINFLKEEVKKINKS